MIICFARVPGLRGERIFTNDKSLTNVYFHLLTDIMTDNMSSSTAEEISHISFEDRLNSITSQQLKEAGITLEKGKLKWSDDYKSFQSFIESTFKLKGTWSAPSGHLKLFTADSEGINIR